MVPCLRLGQAATVRTEAVAVPAALTPAGSTELAVLVRTAAAAAAEVVMVARVGPVAPVIFTSRPVMVPRSVQVAAVGVAVTVPAPAEAMAASMAAAAAEGESRVRETTAATAPRAL